MTMLYVGTSSGNLSPISLDPSSMEWGLQDVSASEAGRTQDGTMLKMLVAQKRKLSLSWAEPTAAQTAEILQAFNHEYVYVRYHDAMSNAMETRQFYVGDRSAPFRWFQLPGKGTRYKVVSFDIIEV